MGEMIATRAAYGEALREFGGREEIMVLDADLSSCTMSCRFQELYPERFYNVGIAEANMVEVVNDTTFTVRFYRMGLDNPKRTGGICLMASVKQDQMCIRDRVYTHR